MKHAWTLSGVACLVGGLAACGPSSRSLLGSDAGPGAAAAANGDGVGAIASREDAGALALASATCASSTAKAEHLPLHLVLVLDRSGSMCEYTAALQPRDCSHPSSKWQQTKSALASFFAGADAGSYASLIAFPTAPGICTPSTYAQSIGPEIPLPDTTHLASSIAGLAVVGSTPTADALAGAIQYASALQGSLKDHGKVAVVMATDGLPEGCADEGNIGIAAQEAAAAKSTIPTYVVGVGGLLANLHQLAAAGGTGQAFLVSNANPGQVSKDLLAAMNQIRGSALSCAYKLPSAPSGQTLDVTKVNVEFSPGGGSPTTLAYDKDCSGPGWRYDDASAPTKIEICAASCDVIKADPKGRIDLALGCATVGGVR